MSEQKIDRLLGLVLMLVSVGWYIAVDTTVALPAMNEPGPNAQTFPKLFGMALGFIGLWILALAFRKCPDQPEVSSADTKLPKSSEAKTKCFCLAWVLSVVVSYTLVMQLLGFVPATLLMVLMSLLLMLRIYRLKLLIGLSIGIPSGVYLVFNQVLGVYLPRGTWTFLPWL